VVGSRDTQARQVTVARWQHARAAALSRQTRHDARVMRPASGVVQALCIVVGVALTAAWTSTSAAALLPVPPYSACMADDVTLVFAPDRAMSDAPAVVVRRARGSLLGEANLHSAEVAERCSRTDVGRVSAMTRPRTMVAGSRVKCTVATGRVVVQIGDFAEPVDGASTRRSVALTTGRRLVAIATIGRSANLVYDSSVCTLNQTRGRVAPRSREQNGVTEG
jgi:hypothetical protein